MSKWKFALTLLITSFCVGLFLVITIKPEPLRDALIFFPIDPNATFEEASSRIDFQTMEDEDEYTLDWTVSSVLNQKAYLRQDVSLLFEDGYLKDTLSTWKENTTTIEMEKDVKSDDSGHYRVVTFHHAELHYPNDEIKSAQKISFDQLYVIDSPLSPLHAFRTPETEEEKESKRILDYILTQQQNYDWDALFTYYNLPKEEYLRVPLTDLVLYEETPLPGLTPEKHAQFLGGLWEGLYKNYVLGITKQDGTTVSPIGSTVPVILVPNSADHFFVLFRTEDGEPVQLLQTIQ
ncbi:hypothetical protein [Halalkalibacter akibai]|uniref:Uncharacterized protein n=1 Tax=Halalkalibacter akibai (strain ATCC 43226 / DSM 21942 / CIP 109018 / JCM 9157 / 1139) TaxID=1236973 RepID=W4QMY5_HALA3|nr:hypothetical protein [Halalkalibacter akibai]GAE33460.1 hypothetical protein JCM9157_463 [Halalkalibacter akibai JCM 9157]